MAIHTHTALVLTYVHFTCTPTHTRTHTYTHTHTHTHTNTHTYALMHTYTLTHVRTHARTHTHMHPHKTRNSQQLTMVCLKLSFHIDVPRARGWYYNGDNSIKVLPYMGNFAGEKLVNLTNRESFAKVIFVNIHRYTKNVFGWCTDFSLFTKFFLTNTFYLYGSPPTKILPCMVAAYL